MYGTYCSQPILVSVFVVEKQHFEGGDYFNDHWFCFSVLHVVFHPLVYCGCCGQ